MTRDELKKELQVGVEIYYSGDGANDPGFGKVTKVNTPDRFDSGSVEILMEDERVWKRVGYVSFIPGPGVRFHIKKIWQKDRAEKVKQFLEGISK